MTNKNIYVFNDCTKDNKKLKEIREYATTVIKYELKNYLPTENSSSVIKNCIQHDYIPVDIWHNFRKDTITPLPIQKYFLAMIQNFIRTGVYKLPTGYS